MLSPLRPCDFCILRLSSPHSISLPPNCATHMIKLIRLSSSPFRLPYFSCAPYISSVSSLGTDNSLSLPFNSSSISSWRRSLFSSKSSPDSQNSEASESPASPNGEIALYLHRESLPTSPSPFSFRM